MSLNYNVDLQRSIDFLVQKFSMKEIRSDDPYLLQLYSGDEEAAVEGLRTYVQRKGQYFDRQRYRMMPRCELIMIDGHAVVDLIHVFPDKVAEFQREKFVESRRDRMNRNGGFY